MVLDCFGVFVYFGWFWMVCALSKYMHFNVSPSISLPGTFHLMFHILTFEHFSYNIQYNPIITYCRYNIHRLLSTSHRSPGIGWVT